MSETLTVDQTLHGYSKGHRLLASSTEFVSSDERVLLMMSDLSGPSVVEGFREYLTGYPLPSGRFYAVAKTWYASEMERPGCVWTHTLLIPAEKIAAIRNAASLLYAFSRPGTDTGVDYCYPVPIAPHEPDTSDNLDLFPERHLLNESALNVISQLYLEPDAPVGIAAKSGTQFEALVLLIWSQQWPQLRMNFGFCTGALSERAVAQRPLDLQFGPYRRSRSMRSAANVPWLRDMLQDLLSTSGTDFRRFLWQVSGDLRTRADFAKLAQIYYVNTADSKPSSILAVATAYPSPAAAKILKRFIGQHEVDPTEEGEILSALAATGNSFDAKELEIESRALDLYSHNPLAAIQLVLRLVSVPASPLRDQLVRSVALSLTATDLSYISRANMDSLAKLAGIAPELPETPAFWLTDISLTEKVDLIKTIQRQEGLRTGKIIQALLRSGNQAAAGLAFNDLATPLDSESLGEILGWASESEGNSWILTRPEWSALNQHPALMCWFSKQEQIPPHMLSLLAQIADPFTAASGLGMQALSVAASIVERSYSQRDDVAAFMFVAACRSSDERAAAIAVSAFTALHAMLYYNRLSYRAWQLLQRDISSMGGDEWDQCEKLRRALSLAFERQNWPPHYLWRLISDDDELSYYMLRTAREFRPAYRILRAAWLAAGRTDQSTSPKQKKKLRKLFDQ